MRTQLVINPRHTGKLSLRAPAASRGTNTKRVTESPEVKSMWQKEAD